MSDGYIVTQKSTSLNGTVSLYGAKNAVLVMMASLVCVRGKSILTNVPYSADVINMMSLLSGLGAQVLFDPTRRCLEVDTSSIHSWTVSPHIMKKMRASVLVMGALLTRFGKAKIACPGGCTIGKRSIDMHIRGMRDLGVMITENGEFLDAQVTRDDGQDRRVIFEYPSVGATENVLLYALACSGVMTIVNAALEPEVADLIEMLHKMGAHITVCGPATIVVRGGYTLSPVVHDVVVDRLEAGALLCATAAVGGEVTIDNARVEHLDLVLSKFADMGHDIIHLSHGGITLRATSQPRAVDIKTGPYPSFPTDLQAPMMLLQCIAEGESVIEETVFENRLMHAHELNKMGAQITLEGEHRARIRGVEELFGTKVIASDIRASVALVIAGLVAQGTTYVVGLSHWRRGLDRFEHKIKKLGGHIAVKESVDNLEIREIEGGHEVSTHRIV